MKQRNWVVVPGVLLAACLQVGIAQAQSSVAVYGRIDLGVRHGPMDLSKSEDSVSYMDDSSRARLGFMGTEDLGGGNSAFFQLEHRFNGTTAATSAQSALASEPICQNTRDCSSASLAM